MSGILVIAYGNPLRCDDGLAWRAAEKLSQLNLSNLEIITCHQLTPELAVPLSQAAAVFFIDAARVGVPGDLACAPLKPQLLSGIFTHECSPASLLGLAQELYGRCAPAFTISVCGECFDHGEILSAKVEESLPRVVAIVREFAND
jgi:hydrogenase maturation protease